MSETHDMLATRAIRKLQAKQTSREGPSSPIWIAITGGPGAGKSTLADAVAKRINEMDVPAVAIPMDGYHYTKEELQKRDAVNGLTRRGAPWTFDAEALCLDLAKARKCGEAKLPEYSREISDPIPGKILVEKHHKIVLVEGNYLLFGYLDTNQVEEEHVSQKVTTAFDQLDCPIPVSQEVNRWKSLLNLWDETWFVVPKGGLEKQQERLIQRSLQTWTPEKTRAWGGKTDLESATKRANYNDMKNARLVECCRTFANLVVNS